MSRSWPEAEKRLKSFVILSFFFRIRGEFFFFFFFLSVSFSLSLSPQEETNSPLFLPLLDRGETFERRHVVDHPEPGGAEGGLEGGAP